MSDTVIKQFRVSEGDAARFYISPPTGETWKVKALAITPNETSATDASNYITATAYKANTAITAGRTNNSSGGTAFTVGTTEAFALTGVGKNLEVSGANPFNVRVAKAGSGVGDLSIMAEFERMRI
jgi:hypothetical protein